MDSTALFDEIASAFPAVEMPGGSEIQFHESGCFECDHLRVALEDYRGKEIAGEAIRLVHQEMSCLSAKAWRWILPHYLRVCLTAEPGCETEFLIYALSPGPGFRDETLQRLSALHGAQVACLIHFLEWCLNHERWKEYCPEEVNKAMAFLYALNV